MAKLIAAEKVKVGLRHAVVCPDVTRRIDERISPKQACSCSFVRDSGLAKSVVNFCPPGVVWFAYTVLPFLGVMFVLLCF